MTDPNDRIVEHTRRESPADDSHFFWEVAFPTLFTALTVTAMFWAFFGMKVGIAAGTIVSGGLLLIRLYQWDRYAHGIHVVERKVYREPDTTRREWAPVVQDNGDDGNGGHRWRISGWYFSEAEWRRLWSVLRDGTVTRDGLASVTLDNGARMFPNITARYSEYISKLQQMGWLDGDNRVTNAARVWFEERDIASPTDST